MSWLTGHYALPSPVARRRLIAALAVFLIGLQFGGSLRLSVVALVIWLAALAVADRPVLPKMWLPRFWAVTLLFAAGSGLLLGSKDLSLFGLELSSEGLEAGLLMVVRGAFIFGLALWASRNLSGEQLVRVTERAGVPRLGRSVTGALRLLPELMSRLERAWRKSPAPGPWWQTPRRAYRGAVEVICETARLAEQMAELPARGDAPRRLRPALANGRPPVFAIVGPPGSGKTTALRAVAARLRELGLRPGGISQPTVFRGGVKTGYRLRDESNGQERAFARRRKASSPGKPGFEFDAAGWRWARERILDARRHADIVLVDEIGRLEAEGGGHLPALLAKLDEDQGPAWVLAVRADCAARIQSRLGKFTATFQAGADPRALEDFIQAVAKSKVDAL